MRAVSVAVSVAPLFHATQIYKIRNPQDTANIGKMGVFPFAKALSENNPTSAVCAQIEPKHFLILIGFARGVGVSRVSVD